MSCSVVVKPLAEQDAAAAYDYYESTVTGLGSRFLSEVDRVLALISERPEMYQEVLPGIRRALTRVFPYGIFLSLLLIHLKCSNKRRGQPRALPEAAGSPARQSGNRTSRQTNKEHR